MNKTLIVAAIAALAAGAASAQSSVTVYGRLNVTAEDQKNLGVSGTQKVLQNNSSRIGFKGSEDLGGGLSAQFFLEDRFNVDTGSITNPNVFWRGGSWVGLTSSTYGSIKGGRILSGAYLATADYVSMHNHDTGTSSDALYLSLANEAVWNNNSISYTTPSLGGLTVEGVVTAAENTARTNKLGTLAGNYDAGPLHLGLGYEYQAKPVGGAGNNSWVGFRGLYELGAFTFGGYYQRSDCKNAVGGCAATGTRDNFRLSGMYALGASEFHLNFGHAGNFSNMSGSKADQYTVAYNYNLSKRTKVYGFYTGVKNGTIAYEGIASKTFSSLAIGVRHNF